MTSLEITHTDFLEGSEAYIRYCSGIAMVQYPYEMNAVHGRPEVEQHVDEILLTARSVMVGGLRRVMQVVQPKDEKGEPRHLNQGKSNFKEVEASMREIVDFACVRHDTRLDELNEMYKTLRPAPFLNKTFYSKLASGRYQRIKFAELMDDFVPHILFMEAISGMDSEAAATKDIEPVKIEPGYLSTEK